MIRYGQTWWGQKWLNALTDIDWENRLPRGRAYARSGAVKTIDIKSNVIHAEVQGRKRFPYKIRIQVPPFKKKEKACIIEKMTQSTIIMTELMNRKLPESLYELVSSEDIPIFPESWDDLEMSCSCPDWAVPCKHLAAVIYIIANEIDKNPFLVFHLHGFDVLKLLQDQGFHVESVSKGNHTTFETLTVSKEEFINNFKNKHHTIEDIDFSLIPYLRENLLAMLSPNPLFFEKNFKSILKEIYTKCSSAVVKYQINEADESGRKHILNKTSSVRIILDQTGEIRGAVLTESEEEGHRDRRIAFDSFVSSLQYLEPKNLLSLCPDIRILYALLIFTLGALEKDAFIPQLLSLGDSRYRIRWIPAILNETVNNICSLLANMIPQGMVKIQWPDNDGSHTHIRYQTPDEQVITLFSLFIDYFFKLFDMYESIRWKHASTKATHQVLSLFLSGSPVLFERFEDKEIPNTIQIWLNKFYLGAKEYILLIKIKEKGLKFSFEFLVDNTRGKLNKPVSLSVFLVDPQYCEARYEVLRDLSLLSEHYEPIRDVIETEGKRKLIFDSETFTEVFYDILPVLGMFGIRILLPTGLKSLVKPQLSLMLDTTGSKRFGSFLDMDTLLDFDWKVAIGDEQMDLSEFRKRVKDLSGIVRMKDRFVLIDQKDIDALLKRLSKPPSLSYHDILKAALTREYHDAPVGISQNLKDLINRLTHIDRVELPENVLAILRPYQEKGYYWIVKNSRLGFGSLIADDMGLGKTLQVLTALLKFKQEGYLKKKKALVIVPTSLITNWQKEIEKFTPDLKAFVYHGANRHFEPKNADLIITSYGITRNEFEKFQKIKWHAVVIDEAQNIKNPGAAQTKAVKKIKADVRIAMSGTPVENRLSEYWSILDFTNKGYLGSLMKFTDEFARPIQLYHDHHKIDLFCNMTAPFILRRLKTDKNVIKDLPEKVENNQYCGLTTDQTALYQNVVENSIANIASRNGMERRGLIFKMMTSLKQICNHPYQFLKRGTMNWKYSGKAMLLFNILDTIYENNEKVLIFTQYKEMGDLLVHFLDEKYGEKPLFLHGGTQRKNRDRMVERFQTENHIRSFVLSLKAGGTGLNLTAANNVIHYDLWWNPAVENQATDRAYRIGQKRNVMVYRLLTRGTFEEKIDTMLQQKKKLAALTVTSGEKWIGELSDNDLRELVRFDS